MHEERKSDDPLFLMIHFLNKAGEERKRGNITQAKIHDMQARFQQNRMNQSLKHAGVKSPSPGPKLGGGEVA